jgi:ASC-1-like (ASCH) protein
MEHLAIMKKSWGLIPKILNGEKKIESRWYKTKHIPWDKIKAGDKVYFKNSGEPVSVKAEVSKVSQFFDLVPAKVKKILEKHGKDDGLGIDDIPRFFEMFKDKKYCILIFLKNSEKLKKPFFINKKGYGAMSSWISIDNINEIKIK